MSYCEELPTSNCNNCTDPYQADNINLLAFLKPLLDELKIITDIRAREKVELEDNKRKESVLSNNEAKVGDDTKNKKPKKSIFKGIGYEGTNQDFNMSI